MTRLFLLCGSRRRDSLNRRLLNELRSRIPETIDVDACAQDEIDLPLFDEDLERECAVQAAVRALHQRVRACDGLLVASPEYNGLPSPFLKNTLDWLSRLPHIDPGTANAFLDTPVLLASASTGWSGGAVHIPPLRALFGYLGGVTFGEPICLPYARCAWDADGVLVDPLFGLQIDDCLSRFVELVERRMHDRCDVVGIAA